MIHHHSLTRSIALFSGDILGFALSFLGAYQIRLSGDYIPFLRLPIREPYIQHLYWYFLFSCSIFLLVMLYFQAYTTVKSAAIEGAKRAMNGWIFSFFATLSFIYLFHDFIIGGEIPRLILIYSWILVAAFMVLNRWLIAYFFESKSREREVITISIHEGLLTGKSSYHRTYTESSLIKSIHSRGNFLYIIEPFVLNTSVGVGILDALDTYGAQYLLVPSFLDQRMQRARMVEFSGMTYLSFAPTHMSPADQALKRFLDIALAIPACILLLPVFGLIALLIKIEDPEGPVIFRNIRVGKNGHIFSLYKFRYMYWRYCVKDGYGVRPEEDRALAYEESLKSKNDSRGDALYKIKNDPRKMRIGKIIEAYSLDELPQLWNVILGNMSLVGPRPHQPREVDVYPEEYKRVLVVPPGITGMAQTHGRHKNTLEQEVSLDIYYIDRWSIAFDLYLLFVTIFVVLQGKKT